MVKKVESSLVRNVNFEYSRATFSSYFALQVQDTETVCLFEALMMGVVGEQMNLERNVDFGSAFLGYSTLDASGD